MSKNRNRKGRRAYLKRWSSEVVKARPGPADVTERKDLFRQRHDAVKSIGTPLPPTKLEIEKWEKVTPKMKVDEKGRIVAHDPAPPRVRAIILRRMWESDRFCGFDEFHSICVQDGRYEKIYRYFSGMDFFYLLVDLNRMIVKRSIIYKGRDNANRALEYNKITWVHKSTLSPDMNLPTPT